MLSPNIQVGEHNDARLPNVFAERRSVPIMVLCLKHSVLTLYHPGNILFQTMLVNSNVLLVPNMALCCPSVA
jgi:hypothetical protein